jgi:hypothetical protein
MDGQGGAKLLMSHSELAALPAHSIIAVCGDNNTLERVAMQKSVTGFWFGIACEQAMPLAEFPTRAFPVLLLWTPGEVLTTEELDAHHD